MSAPVSVDCCDVVLRDGSTVTLRTAAEADVPAIQQFFERLSPISLYQRFHSLPRLDTSRIRLLVAEGSDALVLVATLTGRIVAMAGYYPRKGNTHKAEVAFAIADELQGRGLGTRLLERLAEAARERNVRWFEADVQSENQKMIDVFSESGFSLTQNVESGVTHVVLSLEPSLLYADKAAHRARVAATASMRVFFEPKSVAVIGASRERGKIGSEIVNNLVEAGFTGTLSVVHPSATDIQGHQAYRTVADIPGPVDLAMVVVPAADVLAVVDDCIRKGVRGICVISAGFGESGPEGAKREAALVEKIRNAGCRLIGPNCMGLLNTDERIRLNATFSPVYPPAGNVAMSTQSGALGLAILDYARQLNIGISSFVSVGNKADVSGNDLMQYWAEDPQTSVILLYLESFGNPKKFSEIARRVSRSKPIVAVKSGRSTGGARAASSHTGALAASDTVVDALFRQAGVIRTNTLQELFDVAALLSHQPLPSGRRVAIVTNAGGPGILAADACEANRLVLATLSDATRSELRSFLPESATVNNPVDMLASAPPEHYARTLSAVLRDPGVDSVLTIFIPPLVTGAEPVASAIHEAAVHSNGKPILAVMMRSEGGPLSLANVPSYAFPESAAIALSRVATYGEWRRKPAGIVPEFQDIRADAARVVVESALTRGDGWLTTDEISALLSAVGIEQAASRFSRTPEDVVRCAAAIGFPVVVKAVGPTLLHKTERKAVVLDLGSEDEVRHAVADLGLRLGDAITGYLVQRMVAGGIEMLVGAVDDPLFGPVIVCGSGGVLAELLADSSSRLHPLTATDAAEMIEELRGARLLRGYRGEAPADAAALQNLILRVSSLLTICPEIRELDLNPVKVLTSGACAVDARVKVASPASRPQTRRVVY
ncbi:MAG: GNAT family N-acetyltransferase [Vicinamibacterales bacterium]